MKHLRYALVALGLLLCPSIVQAASCFWVPLVVTNAVAGTGGLCRLTVNSTTGLSSGATVVVSGILGSTACDGTTTVTTVVSSTLVEVNLAFNILYTSGGTVAGGSWSTTNTGNWASSTGGTVGTCAAAGGVPKQAADSAVFDASSGGGTVTVDTTINGVTLANITHSAFTGTIDFSVNNPSITVTTYTASGGTSTLKCGTGTFTITVPTGVAATLTNATITCGSSTWLFANSSPSGSRTFTAANSTGYGTISISGASTTAEFNTFTVTHTGATFAALTITSPITVYLTHNQTLTLTNAPTWTGTSSKPISVQTDAFSSATPLATVATSSGNPSLSWVALLDMKFTVGVSGTCANCFDLGGNSGITITGPSGGGAIQGIISAAP